MRSSMLAMLLAVGAATAAQAADFPVKARRGFVAPPPPAFLTWSGFYIGGFAGAAFGPDVTASDLTPINIRNSWTYGLDDSFMGGLTIGYNAQFGAFVVGIEGEYGYLSLQGQGFQPGFGGGIDTFSATRIGDWYGFIGGRLGAAFGPALIYAKGGAAFIRVETTVVDNCTAAPCGGGTLFLQNRENQTTWAVGGGIEYAIGRNWSVKAEYLMIDIKNQDTAGICGPPFGCTPGTYRVSQDIGELHTIKAGINYRFR